MLIFGEKWHDKDYDGVVVQIPTALIDLNKLEPMLKEFAARLDKEFKLSRFHPDFERSLYELANFRGKAEYNKEKREEKKRLEDADRNMAIARMNRDFLEVVWEERKQPTEYTSLQISGCEFRQEYIWTDQGKGLRKKAVQEIYDLLDEMTQTEQLKQFFIDNQFTYLSHVTEGLTFGEHWRWPTQLERLYLDAYGQLVIRIELLGVKLYKDARRYIRACIDHKYVDGKKTEELIFRSPRTDIEDAKYLDYTNMGGVRLMRKKE